MADNLALKLLVAGIIGAVIGAAAAERYHFPTGLVYGGFNRGPDGYRSIDPMIGSGRADDTPPWGARPDYWPPEDWPPPPPPRYHPPAPAPRIAWCWQKFEDWNFGTTGHWVHCPPGRHRPPAG